MTAAEKLAEIRQRAEAGERFYEVSDEVCALLKMVVMETMREFSGKELSKSDDRKKQHRGAEQTGTYKEKSVSRLVIFGNRFKQIVQYLSISFVKRFVRR